ncbi:hypothetical protein [Nocardiopsis deserti]|uniref:hypothetical protein n=1 Tax=Nocardiopsis deserti TaxID=2605988 RepID=UPI00123A8159|nr:hypothetical protein [Nocardiopsis deserti]
MSGFGHASSYFTAPSAQEREQETAAADTDPALGVAVLVSGDPSSEHPYLWVDVDGETADHLGDLRDWNGGTGWAFYSGDGQDEPEMGNGVLQ